MKDDSGFTLVELVIAAALLGMLVLIAVPRLSELAAHERLAGAASEATMTLARARLRAISSGRETAVRFENIANGLRFSVFEDGNGNGVRNKEIARGVDRPAWAPVYWNRGDVRFGILSGGRIPDPSDPRRALDRRQDPVRFNNSDLCSFSALGESTPGSLYLTDGVRRMAVVRVDGRAARIHVLYYAAGERSWSR